MLSSAMMTLCGGHVLTLEPPASRLSLEERGRIELMGLSIALDSS